MSMTPALGGRQRGTGDASGADGTRNKPWHRGREELLLTVLLFGFGLYILIDAGNIQATASFSQVGPRFFPYVVGVLLTTSSLWLTFDVLRGRTGHPEETDTVDPKQPINWRSLSLVAGVIVGHGLLISWVGWIVATAFLFWGIAFATGSRRWVLDPVIAIVASVSIYFFFTEVLSVYLPGGLLAVGS